MPRITSKKPAPSRHFLGYEQKTDWQRDGCAGRAAIDVIRGRWKPSILFQLKPGAKRFTELQADLKGITAQALTVQLRQLEADGILQRKAYAEIPPRVEYSLSPFGRSLSGVMRQLEDWGAEYLRRQAEKGGS